MRPVCKFGSGRTHALHHTMHPQTYRHIQPHWAMRTIPIRQMCNQHSTNQQQTGDVHEFMPMLIRGGNSNVLTLLLLLLLLLLMLMSMLSLSSEKGSPSSESTPRAEHSTKAQCISVNNAGLGGNFRLRLLLLYDVHMHTTSLGTAACGLLM